MIESRPVVGRGRYPRQGAMGLGERLSSVRRRVETDLARVRLRVATEPRPLQPDRAVRELRGRGDILFLCHGNICRSPMAAAYLQRELRSRNIPDIEVDSAGFTGGGRPSPELARRAARNHGVDLTDHRSTVVDVGSLRGSDIVFLMDAYNFTRLEREFPSAVGDAYLLGGFLDDGFEIADPHGSDREGYRRSYRRIVDAVDRLVEHLRP